MNAIDINENFIEEFTGLIEINKKDFNLKNNLNNYASWDSLAIVSMIALVDQYFNVRLRGQEIESCSTLEEIFLKIKELQI